MASDSSTPPSLLTQRHAAIMFCLFGFLAGIYWFTYSGRIISTDELFMFDAAESLARRGNVEITLASHFHPFRYFPISAQPPVTAVNAEPMQVLVAAVLFALAEAVPGVGLVHVVWLLNILVCAAGGAAFFLYARSLGYTERVAIAGALIYGLGTIAWPYSKTFFREPLAMLLLFGAALCLNAWRERRGRSQGWFWLGGFAVIYLMALLTKEVALFAIPALLAVAFPRLSFTRDRRQWMITIGGAVGFALLLFLALSFAVEAVPVLRAYDPMVYLRSLGKRSEFIGYALLSYLFSPGRSLIAFSPVLLLGLPGLWVLIRARRWREALTPVLAVGAFIIGYAVIRNAEWFGGQAWGPRFLVPVTLFATLTVLPVLRAVTAHESPGWARWGVAGIVGGSVLVQISCILLPHTAYFEELARRGVVAWAGGTWDLAHVPLAVIPGLLSHVPLDFAWLRAEGAGLWLPLAATALTVGAGLALREWLRQEATRSRRLLMTLFALPVSLGIVFYIGLRSIYNDPRYLGGFAALHELFAILDEQAHPDDILVLTNPTYQDFVYNYYRNREVLLLVLPTQIGERPSPEQPPGVESNHPDMLLHPRYSIFLNNLPEYTDRVWLLNSSGPFTDYTIRPVEWFMARHYFPLAAFQTDESARLLLFDVNSDAAPDQAMRWPEHTTDARFASAVELLGYDLPPPRVRVGPFRGPAPLRTAYAPGEVVPLSLLWRALETPSSDYNVAVFVISPDGLVVAQHDSAPQGGFRPMNGWSPGETVRDNHALALPADLMPRTYDLWVKVYAWQTGEALPVSGENETAGGQAARLTTIQVSAD